MALGIITQELERAAYCAQTVDAFRAYAAALEEELDDVGEQAAECARLEKEVESLEARVEEMESEYTESMGAMEDKIETLNAQIEALTPESGDTDSIIAASSEYTPAQAPAICSAGLPTVADNTLLGEIVELRTVDGDAVRVARQQFENPGLSILATFTRKGASKGGRGIHRGNLLTDGAELTPAALLESALKAHGWRVARYPRSAEQRAKLAAQGYEPIIQAAPGQFEPHPLGLAWAKPCKASSEAKAAPALRGAWAEHNGAYMGKYPRAELLINDHAAQVSHYAARIYTRSATCNTSALKPAGWQETEEAAIQTASESHSSKARTESHGRKIGGFHYVILFVPKDGFLKPQHARAVYSPGECGSGWWRDLDGTAQAAGEAQNIAAIPKPAPAGSALPSIERDAITALGDFVGRSQLAAILAAMRGEEGEYFAGMVDELAQRIDAMPQTYQQDGMGDAAIVSLHYFNAGSDWYIAEKDADGGTAQAFGYAVLNGMEDCAEVGYISIAELIAHGVELDLYWRPRTLGEVKAERAGDMGGPDGAGGVQASGEVESMQASGEAVADACPTLIPGRWIPNGAENAERIAFDAALGAEVWLIASTRRPGQCAVIAYAGKRTRHDAHYTMRDRAQALQWAGEYMGRQQAAAQRQAERRAEKAAKRAAGHKLKAGDVLRCSWGYDQTNIDYYEVTRLIGARMVEIRAIGAESVNDGGQSMTGDCVPRPGHYIGEPMRKVVSDYDGQSVRIASYASAHKIEPREVGGAKVWPVDHWTAYA